MWKLHYRTNGGCGEIRPSSEDRHIVRDYLCLPECRYLLHQVCSTQDEKGIKSILILSQFPKEGRTFLTSVLAVAASELLKRRVLIVDTLSDSLAASPFYHALDTHQSGDQEPRTVRSDGVNIALARRVSHNGCSTSRRDERNEGGEIVPTIPDFEVGDYLRSAREYYDLILIDGCALRAIERDTLHPSILAFHSDSTIIVASARGIERNALASLKELLSRHHIHPLGLVFNQGVPHDR